MHLLPLDAIDWVVLSQAVETLEDDDQFEADPIRQPKKAKVTL